MKTKELTIGLVSIIIGLYGIVALVLQLTGVPQTVVALSFFYYVWKIFVKKKEIDKRSLNLFFVLVIVLVALYIIAYLLDQWVIGFVNSKLTAPTDYCSGAEFNLTSASFSNGTLYLRLNNNKTIGLTLTNLYLFYPDYTMETFPLNTGLLGNEIKQFTIQNVKGDFTSGRINTNCPDVFLDFTYSNDVIR